MCRAALVTAILYPVFATLVAAEGEVELAYVCWQKPGQWHELLKYPSDILNADEVSSERQTWIEAGVIVRNVGTQNLAVGSSVEIVLMEYMDATGILWHVSLDCGDNTKGTFSALGSDQIRCLSVSLPAPPKSAVAIHAILSVQVEGVKESCVSGGFHLVRCDQGGAWRIATKKEFQQLVDRIKKDTGKPGATSQVGDVNAKKAGDETKRP